MSQLKAKMKNSSKKIKVLFRLSFLYHRASLDPIYEVMKEDPRFDIYFSCEDEKERKFLFFTRSLKDKIHEKLRQEGLKVTEKKSGFDIVITGDTIRDAHRYGKTVLAFINHGTGIKTILYRNLKSQPHTKYIIFVEGPYRKRKIIEEGALFNNEVYVVGYPKLDPIFQGKLNREEIMKKWGLDPSKKTILYAPTYKPTSIYALKDAIFEYTKDFNLIIKLHPYSWRGKYAPHSQHRIIEKRLKKYNHAVLIPPEEHKILPFIHVADVMITEASSTMFEFLAIGKYGIIYNLPYEKLKHHDGTPILSEDNREFLKGAFVHVDSPNELPEAILRALNPTPEMQEMVQKYRNDLFYKLDGNASKRIVEKLVELYEEGGHENTLQ